MVRSYEEWIANTLMGIKEETDVTTMKFDDYVTGARETAIYPGRGEIKGLLYTAIGLGGEVGELQNKVKKILRDDDEYLKPTKIFELVGELGDILWYVAMMCDELGVSMDNVAEWNIKKLAARKMAGTIGGSGDSR